MYKQDNFAMNFANISSKINSHISYFINSLFLNYGKKYYMKFTALITFNCIHVCFSHATWLAGSQLPVQEWNPVHDSESLES